MEQLEGVEQAAEQVVGAEVATGDSMESTSARLTEPSRTT
jgi:hypothetical protein